MGSSETFLRQHLDELRHPATRQAIAQVDSRHHAILTLADALSVDEVYDIVNTSTDAAAAALDALADADKDRIGHVLAANPNTVSVPAAGPVAFAATLLLDGQDMPDELLAIIDSTTPEDAKPLLRERLNQLANNHDQYAKEVARLLDALSPRRCGLTD